MTEESFRPWRYLHLISSGLVTLLALAHAGLTPVVYDAWTPDAVWFLGTGLGLFLLGILNVTHVGIEPCRRPTARLVRLANWVFALFGAAAVVTVPGPQAYALLLGLVGQAVAGLRTLVGPLEEPTPKPLDQDAPGNS